MQYLGLLLTALSVNSLQHIAAAIIDIRYKKAVLSQGERRDAAVNFDM